RLPPFSPLFPYTTLFRSHEGDVQADPVPGPPCRPRDDAVAVLPARASICPDYYVIAARALMREPAALVVHHAFYRDVWTFEGVRSEEHTSELQSRFDLVC